MKEHPSSTKPTSQGIGSNACAPANTEFQLEKANQHIERLTAEIKELTWAAEKHRESAEFYRMMLKKLLV